MRTSKETSYLHVRSLLSVNKIISSSTRQAVDKFTYLGSTFSRNAISDDDVNARLAKASAAFGRRKNVWNRRGIATETKIKVYRAVVLTTLLYGYETWAVHQGHAKKLNHFHTTCHRELLGVKWQDRIPNTKILTRARLNSIHTFILMKSQPKEISLW